MKTNAWDFGKLIGVASQYWYTCTLHAGVKLGVFSVLGAGDNDAAGVAGEIGADAGATGRLLDALCAMGLLEKSGERYRNSPAAGRFLVRDSDDYCGHIIMHHHHLVKDWARLDEAVVSGRPVESGGGDEEVERESFLMGMFNLARGQAPTVAEGVNLDGRRHLLDLGGGPGTYAIHFCLANPELAATIADRETTRPFAEATVARYGLSERIDFLSADFNHDDIGGPYDAVWMSHIIHSNDEATCRRLIKKAAATLQAGGLLLIHDFFLNDDMASPLFPAVFSLNMLLNNPGRSYSAAEVAGMMEEAGVGGVRRLPFQAPNDSYILCGVREA